MKRAPKFIARRRLLSAAVASLIFLGLAARADNANSIIYSKHNLSASGPGAVHATTETEVCVFCHTPHGASATDGPLWNHQLSGATYTTFSSPTLTALNIVIGQPNGSSRLCLSCHDGTIALGSVSSRAGGIAMTTANLPLHTDLTKDHPISFVYDAALATAAGNLVNPNTLPPEVTLDRSGQMQCTACHDPHNDQYGSFLVKENTSDLCLTCHVLPNWSGSAHAMSPKAVPPALAAQMTSAQSGVPSKAAPITSVAHTACASCHVPHAAGTKSALMRFATPEKNCIDCHAGDGPGKNIAVEIKKFSGHPISMDTTAHNLRENLVNPPVRHVTCTDCHNPHASSDVTSGTSQISGALAAVAGVSAGGGILPAVTQEYELCFRCHGDSAARGPAKVPRQFVQTNTRLEFSPGSISFHPVEVAGKNPSVPSLILPLTAFSTMNCSDCHNNDQGPANGGSGANGPHGSAFEPLLERPLLLTDGQPYNPANFAMCYKCHSSTVVDSDVSTSWSLHRKHIEDYRAACTTCHDSHAANQPHLINFNTAYVQPLNGQLSYISTGANHGVCTLTCHDGKGQNKPHNATTY